MFHKLWDKRKTQGTVSKGSTNRKLVKQSFLLLAEAIIFLLIKRLPKVRAALCLLIKFIFPVPGKLLQSVSAASSGVTSPRASSVAHCWLSLSALHKPFSLYPPTLFLPCSTQYSRFSVPFSFRPSTLSSMSLRAGMYCNCPFTRASALAWIIQSTNVHAASFYLGLDY